MASNEKVFGFIPARDGSDWNRGVAINPEPIFTEVINWMSNEVGFEEDVDLAIIGKLGSPGSAISGISAIVNLQDILNAWRSDGTERERWTHLMGGKTTFKRIAAIVIKRL